MGGVGRRHPLRVFALRLGDPVRKVALLIVLVVLIINETRSEVVCWLLRLSKVCAGKCCEAYRAEVRLPGGVGRVVVSEPAVAAGGAEAEGGEGDEAQQVDQERRDD